jgi:two-component system sensor histidine kinase QseC
LKHHSYSLRRRLLASLLVSMLVILGAVGFFANFVSQHEADEIFSARLATSARVLEALLARQLEKATLARPVVIQLPPELETSKDDRGTESGHPYEGKIAFQVWNEDGVLLAKSASSPDDRLGPIIAGFHEHRAGQDLWHVFALKSGPIWIFAAEKHDVRDEMADEISLSILTPLIVGSLLLLVIVNAIALQSIKPVEELAEGISSRDPASLQPIALAKAPVELEPVIRELNKLLIRVQEAFSREQHFIDSAAHELRTPITAFQLHVQNALTAETMEAKNASLASALDASRRAARLAEQLLVFSRISAKDGAEARRPISMADVCRDVALMLEPITQTRSQSIHLELRSEATISGEKSKLERLVRNLIENASQYGPSPGVIGVSVDRQGDWLEVGIDNGGPAITEEEKARIFIPYYRTPGSKSAGSGLGLSIAKEIVLQHDGEISVEDKTPGHGVRFVMRFALQR